MQERRRRWSWAASTLLAGLAATGALAWAADVLDRHNEAGLLRVQSRQAAGLIASAITGIRSPLDTTAQVARATDGDARRFAETMSPSVGTGRVFVAAALLDVSGPAPRTLAALGTPPLQDPLSAAGTAFVQRAATASTFVVMPLGAARTERVAYAIADPGRPARFVVYAERAIPENRQVDVESDLAFEDLRFATYLGPRTVPDALATTNLPPSELPVRGTTETLSIPFGDTTLTLVTAARGHLGGVFAQQLPWILLVAGTAASIGAAAAAARLERRGRQAQHDASTITELYQRLDVLYGEQRGIAQTLQQALLPRSNPHLPGVELASTYVAGTRGVDVGGDWYSVVPLGEDRFAFVVGDVSGRGVEAAAIMARLRFTTRAYLYEGHAPEVVLGMCAAHLDLEQDGHFATMVAGVADLRSRTVRLACAGHPPPLLVTGDGARFLSVPAGPPLGIAREEYAAVTADLPPGAVLLAFTDGLVERRDEDVDQGLARLVAAVESRPAAFGDLLPHLVTTMTGAEPDDDIAILAIAVATASPAAERPA